MKKSIVLSLVASAILIAGCSSTHSPEIQASIDRSKDAFEGGFETQAKKYRPRRSTIGEIHTGFAYHDINDYTLIQKDERILPSVFQDAAVIKELKDNKQYSIDEFAALVYRSFGVILDTSSSDLVMLDSESEDERSSSFGRGPSEAPDSGITSDSAGNYEALSSIVGESKSTSARDRLKLKRFSFDGTLKGLLDYVAQLNGLKWKYDETTDKAFLYRFNTEKFQIYEFADDITASSNITSDATQDSEGTSGGSKKKFSRDSDIKAWSEIKASIGDMLSDDYGKATFNGKSGYITVKDNDYNLSQIKDYVDNLNKIATTEITVEFKIIQFEYNDADNHAINQNYLNEGLQNNLLGSFDVNFGSGSLSPDLLGNLGAFQEIMQGNFLSIATDSSQYLMGFLNTIGTAEVSYETQFTVYNNEWHNEQKQRTEEYIASISRSNYVEGNGQENISTERDVAVDGLSLSIKPKIIGDKISVSYAVNRSDFIGLKDAGLGAGLEGVKLKTQSALNLDNSVSLYNGVPKVVKLTHSNDESTSSQGMFDDLFWLFGGNETRDENKTAFIVTMTAFYNNK